MARSHSAWKNEVKARAGSCQACGLSIPTALIIHHYTPAKLRNKRRVPRNEAGTTYIVLCASCHHILHHEIGWNESFSDTVDKSQCLKIIHNIRDTNRL